MEPLLLLLIPVALLLIPLAWLIINYNRMARLRQEIAESWSDINVELKRRYELIPNLVETVKGYAKHEQQTLTMVIELRNKAMTSRESAPEKAADESALMLGVKKLFAIAEAYPQLRADVHFLSLQKELANTEDRIAASRRFFNANVRELNQLCQTVPTNLIARWFGFEVHQYFQLQNDAERVVPRTEF